jgi:large repetitive protein
MVGGYIRMGGGARIARLGAAVVAALLVFALAGARPAMAAPILAIESPGAGSVTNHSSVTVSGNTSEAGSSANPTEVVVKIHEGSSASGNVVQSASATPAESGAWSAGVSLGDGTYTAVAEQTVLGETGTSPAVTFRVDTTPPKVTMNALPSPTKNSKPTLTGNVGTEEGDLTSVTVTILKGSNVVETGSATVSGSGWTYSVQTELSDGTYTARAAQKDEAGNTGTASQTFTVKMAAPKPTLDAVATPTKNSGPTLKGKAGAAEGDLPQVEVTIYRGAFVGGPVQAAETVPVSNESWSYTPSALPDGTYTAQATQRDEAGNSGVSEERTFTIDTIAPNVTIDSVPSPTSHTKPTLEGKLGSEAGDIHTAFVRIHEGTSPEGPVAASGSARISGESWQYTPEGELSAGTYTAVVQQEDTAHNLGHANATFTIKTSKPLVTLNAPEPDSNNRTPSFSGTADTGEGDILSVTVRVYSGATVIRTLGAPVVGGAWSTSAIETLPDGTYSVQAEQLDEAGNKGFSSRPSFTVDTVAPVITLKPVPGATKSPTPTFTGNGGTAPGDLPTVTVTITGTTALGAPVSATGTTQAGKKGEWSFTAASLEEGSYSVQASQSDQAHNVGHSEAVAFKVITKPPTVVLNPPAARSNNREPTFSGTASAPTKVTVTVYNEKGLPVAHAEGVPGTGGVWTTGPAKPQLPNEKGQIKYSAAATQTDEAGNSTTTARAAFAVDVEAPALTMNPVAAATNEPSPGFGGMTNEVTPVTVYIYAAGHPVAESCEKPGLPVTSATVPATGLEWSLEHISASLADGRYVALATETSHYSGAHCAQTAPVPFRVDTVAPQVAIGSPASQSATVATARVVTGSAGTAEGDLPRVTVELFSGEGITPGQGWIQSESTTATHGSWSVTFAGLTPGAYTVRATQADEAGNVGTSAPQVFRLLSPPRVAGNPAASFSWYPASPHAGESVTLVSSSTDATSPLTGFAWDLAGAGPLHQGASVITTAFASAGAHPVRLRVADASGASSTVTETISVGGPVVDLLRPFPLVRIVTTRSGSGLRLRVLSILAAPGARVTITCKGRRCPLRKQSKVASTDKVGLASVSFARFQRTLAVGTTLEIRVYQPGTIGKYTSLSVRRGGVLKRIDKCLAANGTTPMTCPTA